MNDEPQTDRIVQALNALTLAILSVRRELAAGPVDPTREQFLRDEESFSKVMEQSARDLLEYGTADLPDGRPARSAFGAPTRETRGSFTFDVPDRAAV